MPFLERFAESGESEIVDKLFVVFERDLKPALDRFYLADNLPPLAVMTEGEDTSFSYPLLVAGIERNSSEDNGEYLKQELRVGLGLVVDGTSVADARKKAKKYVRALKAVIWKADPEELIPDLALDFIVDIDHRYFRHGTNGTAFTQPVEFELKFRFGER